MKSASALIGFGSFLLAAGFGALGGCALANIAAVPWIAVVDFLGQLAAISLIIVGFGAAVTKQPWGFALSGRFAYSLAKLQMAGWTVLVLATVFTAAEIRIVGFFGSVNDPLQIIIPGDLLAAMGIAVFTTAATPALLALKTTGSPTQGQTTAAVQRMADMTEDNTATISAVGNLMVRNNASLADWSDLVAGDEVANAGTVDLSKVQQLLITILLLVVYAGMFISEITNKGVITGLMDSANKPLTEPFASLPQLSSYFVGLMAISHAGYLGYKAMPKAASDAAPPAGPVG